MATNIYRNASNKILKNCTEATGDEDMSLSNETSLMGSSNCALESLNTGLHFSIHSLKPSSVAGKVVFEVEEFANLMEKR